MPNGLSIVTPTYNRVDLLPNSISSALVWLNQIGLGEIIIVDDGSTDGTQDMIQQRWAGEMAAGRIRLHKHERNAGVTAAKNSGARLASFEWIVFLDSDDVLLADAALPVSAELGRAGVAPVVFFRCIDRSSGNMIGASLKAPLSIDLKRFLSNWRWGECLPVVRKAAILRYPYEAELRGYEGLSYARMAREIGPLLVNPLIARVYNDEDHDRVTTTRRRARSHRQARYTGIVLSEFFGSLSMRARLVYLACHLRARAETLAERYFPW